MTDAPQILTTVTVWTPNFSTTLEDLHRARHELLSAGWAIERYEFGEVQWAHLGVDIWRLYSGRPAAPVVYINGADTLFGSPFTTRGGNRIVLQEEVTLAKEGPSAGDRA